MRYPCSGQYLAERGGVSTRAQRGLFRAFAGARQAAATRASSWGSTATASRRKTADSEMHRKLRRVHEAGDPRRAPISAARCKRRDAGVSASTEVPDAFCVGLHMFRLAIEERAH